MLLQKLFWESHKIVHTHTLCVNTFILHQQNSFGHETVFLAQEICFPTNRAIITTTTHCVVGLCASENRVYKPSAGLCAVSPLRLDQGNIMLFFYLCCWVMLPFVAGFSTHKPWERRSCGNKLGRFMAPKRSALDKTLCISLPSYCQGNFGGQICLSYCETFEDG